MVQARTDIYAAHKALHSRDLGDTHLYGPFFFERYLLVVEREVTCGRRISGLTGYIVPFTRSDPVI